MSAPLRFSGSRLRIPGRYETPLGMSINWQHPLANGLQSFCLPDGAGGMIDLAKPRNGPGGTRGLRSSGPSVGGSWSVPAASCADLAFTGAFSVATIGYLTATGTNAGVLSKGSYAAENNNDGWALWTASAGTFSTAIFNNNSSVAYLSKSTVTFSVGNWMLGMATDGTSRFHYVNGQPSTLSSTGSAVVASTSSQPLTQNGSGVGTTAEFENYVAAAWSRALSAGEMLLFNADPCCLLTPIINSRMLVTIANDLGLYNAQSMNAIFLG